MFLRPEPGAGAQQSYATYILIKTTASGALCPPNKGTAPCCAAKPASQVRVLPSSKPCRTRRRGPRRPVPGRRQGAAPSDIHAKLKASTSSAAVESRRPRAPIPATVGQECFTVRQTQRLGLSVRSNARTPTSQWESRQTAALRASTRAPRRARRSLAPLRPDIWREASLSSPPRPDI